MILVYLFCFGHQQSLSKQMFMLCIPQQCIIYNNYIALVCRCDEPSEVPAQCRGVVRSTNLYAPSTHWLDDSEDSMLLETISQITGLPGLAMCGELFNTLYCTIRYPACTANLQQLRPICESQCPMIEDQVQQCLSDIPHESSVTVTETLLDRVRCNEMETYYRFPSQYASDNPDECLNISELSLLSVL